MGWGAARKLRQSVANLGRILAVELSCAARGLDLRAPLRPGAGDRPRRWPRCGPSVAGAGAGPVPGAGAGRRRGVWCARARLLAATEAVIGPLE